MNAAKLEVVRKLLALAERAGSEAEAELSRNKALALMQRYAIDEAMLGAAPDSDAKIGSRRFVLHEWVKPKGEMLSWIGDAFGCQTIKHTNESSIGRAVLTVYGWESDLEAVEVLFASLEIQAMRELRMARTRKPARVNGQSFTRSFLVGFASSVALRLQEQRAGAVAESSTGTDLVLVDRSKAVSDYFKKENPRVRSARGSAITDGSGYGAGQAAGARADLGSGSLGGRSRSIGR